MRKTLFILSVLEIVLWGCRTYDEGPVVSLRDPKKVIPGNWLINSYTVDGADSMWVINELHLQGDFNFISYDKQNPGNFVVHTSQDTLLYSYIGSWKHKKEGIKHFVRLNFAIYNKNTIQTSQGMMPLTEGLDWEIIRLRKEQDLWLRAKKDEKEYELKFKPNK